MDYYLKTQSESDLWLALESAGLAKKVYSEFDEEGNPVGDFEWQREGGYDLDIIGTIFKPTGKMLQGEDGPYPEMAALDGFHANLRSHADRLPKAQSDLLAPIIIDKPNSPVRVFAGD